MMGTRLIPILVFIFLLNVFHSKIYSGETIWDTTQKIANTGANIAKSVAPLVDALGGDGTKLDQFINNYSQTVPHVQFPMCRIQPTAPNLGGICTERTTTITMGNGQNAALEANNKVIALLGFQRAQYVQGQSEQNNEYDSTQGVACLQSQLDGITKNFEKINKTLDDAITQFKLDSRNLEDSFENQKKALKNDYEILFKGSNNFDPVKEILDVPGCESLFEHEGLGKKFKSSGLMGVRDEDETSNRIKESTEFNKNAHVIFSDLDKMMNSLNKKVSSMSASDIVNNKDISKELTDGTTDLTQYKFKTSPSFNNSLIDAVNNVRTERQEIINRFKDYLGNSKVDSDFLDSIKNASEKSNLQAQFVNWQNGKKLNCLKEKISGSSSGNNDPSEVINKLISESRPSRKNMAGQGCSSNVSCKNYINSEISKLFKLQGDSQTSGNLDTIETRISKISAVKNDLTQTIYTFPLKNSPGTKVTLGQLLKTYNEQCQKEISLNQNASFDHVVKKIMPRAIDDLSKFDKNLKRSIVANIKSEIFDCNGKAINYGSCSSVLPGESKSFCYKQASQCSQNIQRCQSRVEGLIEEKKVNITSNIKNMNDKVELFNNTTFQDLQLKMKAYTSFVDSTLVGLSRWAGYKTSPNEFNFKKPDAKDNVLSSEYEELTKPPFSLKLLSPEQTVAQYSEMLDKVKEKNQEILDSINTKFNKEISTIKQNYANAITAIDKALENCNKANGKVYEKIEKNIDKCKVDKEKEKIEKLKNDFDSGGKDIKEKCEYLTNTKNITEIENKLGYKLNTKFADLIKACESLNSNSDTAKEDSAKKEHEKFITKITEELKEKLKNNSEIETECINTYSGNEQEKVNRNKKPDKEKKKKDSPTVKK